MNKPEALKLVGNLCNATKVHVMVANGRGRSKKAPARELKAAKKVLAALTTEPIEEIEIEDALGW